MTHPLSGTTRRMGEGKPRRARPATPGGRAGMGSFAQIASLEGADRTACLLGDRHGAAHRDVDQNDGLGRRHHELVVGKADDGSTYALDMSDDVDQLGGFAELAWVRSGLLTDEEMQEAAATMERGTLAVLIVYENTWAVPFIAAAKESGGELIAGARIPAQDVMDALDALEATGTAESRQPVAATPSGA